MEIFILWLALALIPAVIASKKGRSGFGYFLLAVLLSPLIGLIIALAVSPIEANVEAKQIESGERRKCPHCAELIKQEANVCRFCGRDVTPMIP